MPARGQGVHDRGAERRRRFLVGVGHRRQGPGVDDRRDGLRIDRQHGGRIRRGRVDQQHDAGVASGSVGATVGATPEATTPAATIRAVLVTENVEP